MKSEMQNKSKNGFYLLAVTCCPVGTHIQNVIKKTDKFWMLLQSIVFYILHHTSIYSVVDTVHQSHSLVKVEIYHSEMTVTNKICPFKKYLSKFT